MDALPIKNGTILTMNPAHPEVDAVAVIGDQIVHAGSVELAERSLPPGYRILDLAGRI